MSTHFGFKTLHDKTVRMHFEEGSINGLLEMNRVWPDLATVTTDSHDEYMLKMEPDGTIYMRRYDGSIYGENIPVTVIS